MMTNHAIKVLIAEEDASVARLISATLDRCARRLHIPLRAAAVGTVTEAQAALESMEPHLLIAGSLPGAGALSLWEVWRRADAGGGSFRPCVLLGLNEAQESRVEQCADRWTRTFAKPFSPPELVMRVLTLLVEAGAYAPAPRLVARRAGAVVLDLCCGSGLSTCLAAEGAGPDALVVGIDRSSRTVQKARQGATLLGYRDIGFVVAHVLALPFAEASAHAVQGLENLACIGMPDERRAHEEVRRVCSAWIEPAGCQ